MRYPFLFACMLFLLVLFYPKSSPAGCVKHQQLSFDPLWTVFITAEYFLGPDGYTDCKNYAPDIQYMLYVELTARYMEINNQQGGFYYINKQPNGLHISCDAQYAALTQMLVDDITFLIRNRYASCAIVLDDPIISYGEPNY
jgi:hypothetical protein